MIFGEGLPNSEEHLWRLKMSKPKMTRMLLEVIWGVLLILNRKDLLLLYIHLNIDEYCLVLGVFLLHSADYQQHIWWFMYLKHHLFEPNFWRGPSKLWGASLEIEDEQAKDDQNVAAGHLMGLEGWQTERLFQPTFCYKSLWQCPFWSGSGCISSS